jgi:HK97 family phage major capsid protein
MTIPRQSGAATASYVGENVNISSSQQTTEQITLTAKKLAALTPASNDLLRQASADADAFVRDDLVQVMSLREDLAFIRDDGTSNKPKGIRFAVASGQVVARTQAAATSTLAEISDDLFRMLERVEGANHQLVRPGWIMTSRTKSGLMRLRDANGQLVFASEMSRGELLGFPFGISNQIPKNLGGDETELYFGDFNELLIGDTQSLEIEVFPGGTYHDGANLISGISQDQTVIRTIALHDVALRHNTAFAVTTAVDWGV